MEFTTTTAAPTTPDTIDARMAILRDRLAPMHRFGSAESARYCLADAEVCIAKLASGEPMPVGEPAQWSDAACHWVDRAAGHLFGYEFPEGW